MIDVYVHVLSSFFVDPFFTVPRESSVWVWAHEGREHPQKRPTAADTTGEAAGGNSLERVAQGSVPKLILALAAYRRRLLRSFARGWWTNRESWLLRLRTGRRRSRCTTIGD